ncbi:unnamed protein product [Protopolystoma xenopodis]|uniref:Uncharacterized protein n=1 Tax=Protopolystoma xenopodis TaxID=117903 RepID=A0A448WID6_9PLAT|nr:unnamed protein product [Protopolystoma xenopodis]
MVHGRLVEVTNELSPTRLRRRTRNQSCKPFEGISVESRRDECLVNVAARTATGLDHSCRKSESLTTSLRGGCPQKSQTWRLFRSLLDGCLPPSGFYAMAPLLLGLFRMPISHASTTPATESPPPIPSQRGRLRVVQTSSPRPPPPFDDSASTCSHDNGALFDSATCINVCLCVCVCVCVGVYWVNIVSDGVSELQMGRKVCDMATSVRLRLSPHPNTGMATQLLYVGLKSNMGTSFSLKYVTARLVSSTVAPAPLASARHKPTIGPVRRS